MGKRREQKRDAAGRAVCWYCGTVLADDRQGRKVFCDTHCRNMCHYAERKEAGEPLNASRVDRYAAERARKWAEEQATVLADVDRELPLRKPRGLRWRAATLAETRERSAALEAVVRENALTGGCAAVKQARSGVDYG